MKRAIGLLFFLLVACGSENKPMPSVGDTLIPFFRTRVAETNAQWTKYLVFENGDEYYITCSKDNQILSIWSRSNNPVQK